MIIGVLMAGGKGKRMNLDTEKPLVELNNKPLIRHVLDNLKKSKYLEKIVVAVSPHTKETKRYLEENSFYELNKKNKSKDIDESKINETIHNNNFYNYIETPGDGYLDDLSFLLDHFENKSQKNILLFINSDLPFLSSKIIDNVIEKYLENDKEAMSVLVPLSIFEKYKIRPSYVFDGLVTSGLNILINANKTQNEEKIIIPKIELALNINTIDDIELANYLFKNNKIHDI